MALLRRLVNKTWFAPLVFLLLGGIFRIAAYLLLWPDSHAGGEIANVAIAYAKSGVVADAFQSGQGPTAHVLPLPPIYAGLIYRAFGVQSPASELLLAAIAITVVLAGFALLYRCFGMMGTPRPFRLLALGFLCLVPLNLNLEVVAFRIWEGALAVFLALIVLLALLRLEQRGSPRWIDVAGMALLAALLAFVSPALGLAAYAGCLWLLVERWPPRRWPAAALVAVAALVLVLLPWTVRNARMMGEPVVLRSNFGLELALANYAGAVGTTDRLQAFRDRLEEIHPFESDAAFNALQAAGGEIPYSRGLGDEAKAWIVANPLDFARLCLRHMGDFFFPPEWQWHIYSDKSRSTAMKAAANWGISLAGLAGGLAALLAAGRRYRFALLFLVLPVLPYLIVQPVLRYRYIVFGMMVFFAADLLARLASALPARSPKS